ncbi:MAG: hypothetical protein Q9202_006017 [Teloschistes flavicans]
MFQPSEPESLHAWKELDTMYPFGQHTRGSEPTFRLSLHHSERPSYGAISAGVDPKAISIALSATSSIKILRATRPDYINYQLYEMLEINTSTSAINDVSWAPGGIRPYDLLAAACDDGRVRLYEVTTPGSLDQSSTVPGLGSEILMRQKRASPAVARQTLSGIGAGLAGVSQAGSTRRAGGGLCVQHAWKEVAILSHDDGAPVWRVRWTHDGKGSTIEQLAVLAESRNSEERVGTGAEQFDSGADVVQSANRDNHHAPQNPNSSQGAKVTTLPKEIYRVPRKQVGSAKIALMSVLVEVGNWDAISSIESPRLLLKNRRSSPLLPAHLGAEDAIFGYHAFPYVSLRGEQINSNKFIPRPSVKQFDKSGVCEPCDEEQM